MFDQPTATTEYIAVDTETNGLSGDRCELTEIGAVLVGGGELHEEWDSLVSVATPLGRGIQRFTGISQEMVNGAPPLEEVLPRLEKMLRGRVLVAHNARFDVRVLRQAFARAALQWPDPPVICTVQMARRFAPLQQKRGLARLAGALGVEVHEVHRALPDARTCAQVFCALFGRLCANAPTIGDALNLLGARKVRARPPSVPNRPRGERPHLAALPHEPGVYIFRDADGKPLYVGKSVDLRVRARSHFTSGASWTQQAEHVDHTVTESELGALLLEDRLIKALKPPGNVRGKADPDGYVYIRCRLDIPFPILEVAREPAAGHAVCVGPVRGRAAAAELVEQLNSLFGLRHCGRSMPRREHPSAYGQMGRCLSPCLNDLDPNVYRERLDAALRLFVGRSGGEALLARVDEQIAEASAAQRYERAAWLARRRERLESLLARLGGVLRAIHTGARLVLAPHPEKRGRFDAIWIAGGRVVDWGAVDGSSLVARSARAFAEAPPAGRLGGWMPAEAVAEARLVGWWIVANSPPALELSASVGGAQIDRFLARNGINGSSREGERLASGVA
ncbi:exonuclease domain-containing protein [Solirubrobacter taibaiensis]|nr:exonuclease domain-containing protein [Solirubrobacter taibaiensis]